MTLERDTRDAIGRTVRSLRMLFEDEFGKQASGRFGIRSTPRTDAAVDDRMQAWLDPVESLSLTPAEFAQRDELVHALRYLTSEGHDPGEAVARLIREAAFTAVNRLLAVRVAEAINVLPPVLSAGRQSGGYRDTVGDLFPGLAHDEDSFWAYLQVSGDELAPGVPRLFDRRHPTSAFVPSRTCVDEALKLLGAVELDGAWVEPETLGWGYQFFNGNDVKQMRDASAAPRNSRELAVRNQFFTPRYVVDWLVQNTLGRRLVQAGYDLDLPLLVGEVGDDEPLALDDVRVLDPAVGSGHFLLGSYDLLEQAWQSNGIPPEEAAARILPCLFGVDIDARAAQVAQAVLLLRARRAAPSAELTAPTVVTAVALPHSRDLREQAFGKLSPAARHLADEITDALDQAPLLGSLLKVEQRLQAELASHRTAPRLVFDGTEVNVLEELHGSLDELVSAAASPEERMFTADATDALEFLSICQQRYDTVLMNPPFGDPIPTTKDDLKAAYGRTSRELGAAFVARWVERLKSAGAVGVLVTRQVMFIDALEAWRNNYLLGARSRAVSIADLGYGVLDAQVEVCAAVVDQRQEPNGDFLRLLDTPDKSSLAAAETCRMARTVKLSTFAGLPKSIIVYWLGRKALESISEGRGWEQAEISARTGPQTDDDFRLLRLVWEIPDADYSRNEDRWILFSKGGEYEPYWAEPHLCIDMHSWQSQPSDPAEFTLGGLSYPYRTVSDHCLRWLPPGCGYGRGGPAVTGPRDALWSLMAACFTRPYKVVVEAVIGGGDVAIAGGAARNYSAPRLRSLPAPPTDADVIKQVASVLRLHVLESTFDDRSVLFLAPLDLGTSETTSVEAIVTARRERWLDRVRAMLDLSLCAEPLYQSTVGLDATTLAEVWDEHPEDLPDRHVDSAEIAEYWQLDVASLSERVSTQRGYRRATTNKAFLADRKAELVARLVRTRASRVAEASLQLPVTDDELVQVAHELLSWLVGVSLGRWNGAPQVSPRDLAEQFSFDDPWELPGVRAVASGDRELTVAPQVAGLDASLVHRVRGAADRTGTMQLLESVEAVVGDIGRYLSGRFLEQHVSRYSASRRQGPVYWYLATRSKQWGVWLFAPHLDREVLFGMARLSERAIKQARKRIEQLSGFEERKAREERETAEQLLDELLPFSAHLQRITESGWQPDPADGLALTAAPFLDYLRPQGWQRHVEKHARAMQKGQYWWATVQREYFEKRA